MLGVVLYHVIRVLVAGVTLRQLRLSIVIRRALGVDSTALRLELFTEVLRNILWMTSPQQARITWALCEISERSLFSSDGGCHGIFDRIPIYSMCGTPRSCRRQTVAPYTRGLCLDQPLGYIAIHTARQASPSW